MLEGNARASAVGFGAAVVVLGVLFWFVGVEDVLAQVGRADPSVVAALLVVALVWLLAWGLALRTVMGILGLHLSVPASFLVFSAATFSNNVTPFGQAGGEPLTALLISKVADSEYETSLAAIASVDALNFVPSIGFALLAAGYFAATVTLSGRLETATLSVGLLAVGLVVVAVVGWRHRYRVERAAVRLFTPVIRAIGRVVPRWSPPGVEALERRIEGFFTTIERVASDPHSLFVALAMSSLGWLSIMTSLWLSLYALGHPVAFPAVMLAVPLGSVAGVTPLPGGLGGIEAVLIAVLVPTTGLTATTIGAAVVIHRAATYWFPLLVGGGSAAALGANLRG